MFVISVIPLQRGINTSTLTYFSSTQYSPGTLLAIPVRKKEVLGVVVETTSVSKTKSSLRQADFAVRKIPAQAERGSLPAPLIQLTTRLQEYYPASLGTILFSLLPTEVRAGAVQYPTEQTERLAAEDTTPQVVLAPTDERYIVYQSHIRSTFARGGSVMLVVPTAAAVEVAYEKLKVGISDRVICTSPNQTARERQLSLQKLFSASQAVLHITTTRHAYAERHDLASIIIEQAGHTNYLERTRPYLDQRLCLQQLAAITGRTCLIGDTVLRTEDEHRRREDLFPSYLEPPKRLIFPAELITYTTNPAEPGLSRQPFQIFFPQTLATINETLARRQNVFLYAARRGLAPLITCFDCGAIIRCPDSGNPYTLFRTTHGEVEERWFVDPTSGRRVRAFDTCPLCGSWRLRERGIGIQFIADSVAEHFPNVPLIIFDATTATTPKRAQALHTKMQQAKGAIILGTNLALPYLTDTIAVSCVTSLEAAASIPTWRADEMLLKLLLELREKSQEQVIVQARHTPSQIVTQATKGSLEQFYTEEIELRQQLNYPPFATIIRMTWTSASKEALVFDETIKQHLDTYQPHYYNDPYSTPTQTTRHALLRIPTEQWPDSQLLRALRTLPPHVKIEINPDRII